MIKRIVISLILLIACVCQGYAAGRLFPDLKKQNGLTSVYVGKAMLKMAGNVNLGRGMVFGEELVNNLESVEILTAESPTAVNSLRVETERYVSKPPNLDTAFEKEEDGETVVIYTLQGDDHQSYSGILIVVDEVGEMTVIHLKGKFTENIMDSINIH